MSAFIAWAGFVGAWLLVAGPLYQAALELHEQEVKRDDIERMTADIPRPKPVSPWWWLVPPVKYLLERGRNRAFRQAVFEQLGPHELEGLVDYQAKATAWLMVGGGGLCIAAKETYEVGEHYEWPVVVWVVLVVAMALASFGFAAARIRRAEDIKRRSRTKAQA